MQRTDSASLASRAPAQQCQERPPGVFLFNPFAEGHIARGRAFTPVKHQVLRAELESFALPQLIARLREVDPDAAARIDQRNPRRIIRAIEVASAGYERAAAQKRAPRYHCLQLGLTWPHDILVERI